MLAGNSNVQLLGIAVNGVVRTGGSFYQDSNPGKNYPFASELITTLNAGDVVALVTLSSVTMPALSGQGISNQMYLMVYQLS